MDTDTILLVVSTGGLLSPLVGMLWLDQYVKAQRKSHQYWVIECDAMKKDDNPKIVKKFTKDGWERVYEQY